MNKGNQAARKDGKKWDRNSEPILPEEPQEKEEGVVMNKNNGNGNAQPQVPWKDQLRKLEPHCPTCLGDHAKICGKEIEGFCDECAKTLIDEQGSALAEGKLITTHDWMASRLAILEQKLKYAKAAYEAAQAECTKEAAAKISETLGDIGPGQVVDKSRKKGFQDLKAKLWTEKEGDKKYAIMKGLENRVLSLKIAIDKTQTPPPQSTEKLKPVDALAEAEAVLNNTP